MKPAAHQYEDKLLELAYGELPESEATAVEAHVQGCARCRQSLAEIRSVRLSMGQLPQVDPPEAGLDSLLAYAEQAARRNAAGPAGAPSFWKRLMAPLAGVAALSLVAVVGWQTQKDGVADLAPQTVAVKATATPSTEAPVVPAPQGGEGLAAAPAVAADSPERERARAADSKSLDEQADRYDVARQQPSEVVAQQAYGATGLGEQRQQELGSALEAAGKLSNTRRAAPSKPARKNDALAKEEAFGGLDKVARAERQKEAAPAAPELPRDDFSNAAQRGAKDQVAAAPPPASAEPAAAPAPSAPQKKGSLAMGPGFGLSTGTKGGAGRATGADLGEAEAIGSIARAEPKPEAKSKSPSPGAAGDDFDRSMDGAGGARAASREIAQSLSDARSARDSGNRQQEIALAQRALASGATGQQRAEALQRLCEAYDALGLEAQADPYCAALVREFPSSTGARAVAQRRNQPSLNPRPAAKQKASERRLEADELQKAEPAKSAPAQAY